MTATEDSTDTLAVLLYHSFEAESIVLPSGATAGVVVTTNYPFDDVVNIDFSSRKEITVALRIPGWCPDPKGVKNSSQLCRVERQVCFSQSGCRTRIDPCGPSGFFRTAVQSGNGIRPTAMKLHLPMHVRLENRTRNGTAVHRGEEGRARACQYIHVCNVAVFAGSRLITTMPLCGGVAGPLLYSYAAPYSAQLDTECNASGLFPESFVTPSFTCDITLNTTGPLPELNISSDTEFTFRKRTVPAPKPGQGVFASSLAPVELLVSGGASDFSMIPFGATDIRTTELPPMMSLHNGPARVVEQ